MKKFYIFFTLLFFGSQLFSQIGTEFWFAPPEVTYWHNQPGGQPIYLMLSSMNDPVTITISQPANAAFNGGTPITVSLPANSSQRIDLTPNIGHLETEPTNTVLTTGLYISATDTISAYYEVSNTNNCDIFALKGANALGYEFYIPLHNNPAFYNHTFTNIPDSLAYASFDIVATENNTEVIIYTKTDVDGHTAYTPFTIMLNRGETYSCGWTGANYTNPSTHPSGAVVVADKPIAVTIKDDSCHNPSGGCYDLMGDQIVPIDVVGNEYIVVEGQLNATGDESIFILATENNTKVYIDGSTTPLTTLFAGQTYMYNIEGTTTTYIQTSKNVYLTHVTGFGCEEGAAILPPLNCAGSNQISFVRSTTEAFYLTIFVKAGAEGSFTVDGDPTLIQATDFAPVAGTGGTWMYMTKQFNTTDIPVNVAKLVTNSTDKFSLGIINGGATTGCRYGFFSEFVAKIYADAGPDQIVCANSDVNLNGNIYGGANSGTWTTSGDGTFDNANSFTAIYTPGFNDITSGSVNLTITSNSICFPQSDVMTVTFTPAPTADAGADQSICSNNADITLNGTVTVATGGIWTGGAGTYNPDNTTLNTIYTPTAAEISSGSLALTLTTTGNGSCNPVSDIVDITFTPAPIVNAGGDQSVCANNPDVILNGSITVATGGVWTGGTGSFNPSNTALGAIYTPSAGEIAAGTVTLTLTSTGNGNCIAESDQMTITITPSPVVDAGTDQTVCANNPDVALNGSVTGATGGQWSGGLGTFTPSNTNLNAIYTPTAGEIAAGSVTLSLTSTGNGNCNAVTDQMTITITTAPTADAGPDQTVCANNPDVTLNGNVTVASGGIWTGGTGTFSPDNTTLNAVYTPSASEITAGTVTLTLTTTGNGNCNPVSDDIIITITPAPTANAGIDQTSCVNSPDVTLNGSVTVATGGIWSGGAGTFNPNTTDLSAVYTPSASEITAGTVTLTLTTTGNGNCLSVSDQMTITIDPAPTVDAGPDQTKCANNADITLNGTVTGATGGQWTGGLGIFTPNNTSLNTVYSPTATEIASGSITLTLETTGNGNCNPETDNITITFTPAPTVDAGIDQVVCANNSDALLNGNITVATGGIWSGGFGTYNPDNTTLNATYTPSAAEIAVGTVTLTLTTTGNGTCNAESDDIIIAIDDAPIVNAGPDLSSCANNPDVTLNGTVLNATGGQWTGGTGIFNPSNNVLNATYTPSAAEIATGTVTLTLTSTGNGTCVPESDDVNISIGPAPTVNAGTDQTVCGNNPDVVLNGSVTGASGGIWSGGLGVFNPNNSVLNATYTPTAAEVSAGFVDLTLTTTGNGNCNAVSDVVTINYTTSPTVDAGIDQTVCANNPDITLSGSINIATGGIWSGGLGTFTPNNTDLNATYTPTASEISAGFVDLTLTTTGNGNCNPESDVVHITITPAPTVMAGPDQTICVDDLNVVLNGYIAGVTTTGIWSTTGSGSFVPNNTTLNATYVCSSADSVNGNVTLILTSTSNGNCFAVSDSLDISILPAGIASAGTDTVVCANNANVVLNGSVSGGATTGTWTTSGSGLFVPTNTDLNATYIPSANDTLLGSVTLTLTANSCNTATDNITITITPAPFVDAGIDQTNCVDNLDFQLDATVGGATNTGIWTTTGSGTFDPDNTSIDAIYHASSSDSIAGNVLLILTSTNNGNCNPVADTMEINIYPAGIVDAGGDQILCSNNAQVQLNGSISGGATEGIWTTSGSGTFLPNNTTLNAIYVPSSADTATGMVTLALTATNSCNFAMDIITINFTEAPTANAGTDQTVCANSPDVTLSGNITISTGGIWTSSGTGSFVPDNTSLNTTYIPSASDISNGNVFIYLTTTGNGGCNPVTDTMEITIIPAPAVDAGNNQTVCSSSDSTMLQGIVNSISSEGIWTTNGTGYFSPNDSTLDAYYVYSSADTAAGSVTLTLTSINNGLCLAVSDSVTINFGATAYTNAGNDQTICADNLNIALNGFVSGGSTTGIWTSSGNGVFSPNDSSLNATYICSTADSINGNIEIYLTSTNNGGCLAGTDTMNITIENIPVVNAGADQSVCLGTSLISLSGNVTNAAGGIWTTTGTGVFIPNDTALSVAYQVSSADSIVGQVSFTLTSTGSAVCSAVSDDITVNMSIPLTPGFTNTTACENNEIQFFDNTTVNTGTINNWEWNFEGNIYNTEDTSYVFNTTGYHTIIYTVFSSLGCSYSITDSIFVNPLPVVDFSNNTVCYKDSISFTDQSYVNNGNIVSWSWDFDDGNTSSIQNPAHLYAINGDYNVSLNVISNQGCSKSDTVLISVFPLPVADFGYNYDCSNYTVAFFDSTYSQGNPANFWLWNFGNGNTDNIQNPNTYYGGLGDYNVQLIAGSTANCSDTTTQTISIYSINADFLYQNTCSYDSIYFTDNSNSDGGNITNWYWDFGDAGISSEQNPSHLYIANGNYNVSLIIQSQEGCSDTIEYMVTSYPAPVAAFSFTADDYKPGNLINFIDESIGAENYFWDFGDNAGTSTSINPVYSYINEGTYSVSLIVDNEYKCVDTVFQNIIITGTDEVYAPVLPTAFTPNNDGKNDTLYVRGGPFKEIVFRIYNEWGEMIFESNDPDTGWDGTKKGVIQPMGVYVYTVKAITTENKEYTKSGEVTLIR